MHDWQLEQLVGLICTIVLVTSGFQQVSPLIPAHFRDCFGRGQSSFEDYLRGFDGESLRYSGAEQNAGGQPARHKDRTISLQQALAARSRSASA